MHEGLYERLLTDRLRQAIASAPLAPPASPLEKSDAHTRLARHLATEIERALRDAGDAADQASLANALLLFLNERTKNSDPDSIVIPPELLLALSTGHAPDRPETPLALSTLLARPGKPDLGRELAREIASSDRVDALVSFVTYDGFRRLQSALEDLGRRAKPLRLICTTYIGATNADAVRDLARLPHAQVKVSLDGRRSRLHAKAWLFHRETGFSTAYVGSANLSSAALGPGLEWMMKATEPDLPHVLKTFRGAFDSLWEDPEFESFDPDRDFDRLQAALAAARHPGASTLSLSHAPTLFFTLSPYPFQQEILDDLAEQRLHLGRTKSLIVAATGTGKTMIAAFDYARLEPRPRLLFLAHRREILEQALTAFRHVLKDHSFGELLTGDEKPTRPDHLFATIQSFFRSGLFERLGADAWPHVIIDECHHLKAPSYRPIIDQLRPALLVGLTATPERADNQSLLPDFDNHIAAEIRLWHALEKQLVVPFEYYGIADSENLDAVEWSRGAYSAGALDGLFTGNTKRAELIAAQWHRHRGGRTLGFCVSIAHAKFMADHFNTLGIAAAAVTSESGDRDTAPRRLAAGEIRVLFTCDLYNEGVDLPFVDTLLFLRPTSSATVFIQQLGRGLRLAEKKTSCVVLDFVGHHRKEFRVDRLLTAMTGIPRGHLRKAVEADFPSLPSGCHFHLDAVARRNILDNLREAIGGGQKRLADELRREGPCSLAEFLDRTGREPDDVYDAGGFTTLRRLAGQLPKGDDEEARLNRKFQHLTHIDSHDRLDTLASLRPGRLLQMIGYQLFSGPKELFSDEWKSRLSGELTREAAELAGVLRRRAHAAPAPYLRPDWPIALHRHYTRREILTAAGHWTSARKPDVREGVLRPKGEKTELFFVTLDKSEERFSPTTSYEDYAISPTLFHWQSQSQASESSEAGRRYIEQSANGWTFLLFVRPTIDDPYVALGRCRYQSHLGSRPMSITWQLETPIPAELFQLYATLLAA